MRPRARRENHSNRPQMQENGYCALRTDKGESCFPDNLIALLALALRWDQVDQFAEAMDHTCCCTSPDTIQKHCRIDQKGRRGSVSLDPLHLGRESDTSHIQ